MWAETVHLYDCPICYYSDHLNMYEYMNQTCKFPPAPELVLQWPMVLGLWVYFLSFQFNFSFCDLYFLSVFRFA